MAGALPPRGRDKVGRGPGERRTLTISWHTSLHLPSRAGAPRREVCRAQEQQQQQEQVAPPAEGTSSAAPAAEQTRRQPPKPAALQSSDFIATGLTRRFGCVQRGRRRCGCTREVLHELAGPLRPPGLLNARFPCAAGCWVAQRGWGCWRLA